MLSGAVPKHATYVQGALPVGLDSRRRTIRLIPQSGSNGYNDVSSNIIRIDLPPSIGFLDTQNSYLKFRIKVDDATIDLNKPCRMDENAMSWCSRMEIISNNGSVLESIENYGLLVNLLHSATSPDDYRNTAGKLLDNVGSKAERNAATAIKAGKEYCCGIDCSGILGGNSKYLPCQFIQGSLTLVLQLAPFAECFSGAPKTTGARPSYSIENVEYIAECLQFGQDFNMVFEQQLRTAGVDIAYHTYRAHNQALQEGSNQVIQLSQNSKSVKGVYTVMRDKNKYRSPYCESLSTYKSGNLEEFQYDLGGRLFPEYKLRMNGGRAANCYASNLNAFNHFRDHGGGSAINPKNFCASQDETLLKPGAGLGSSYTANPTKRMYGRIANGVDFYKITGTTADKGLISNQVAFGVIFQPDDLDDLASFKIGERYKVTFKETPAGSEAVGVTIVDGVDKAIYGSSPATLTATGANAKTEDENTADEYLYVVGTGDLRIPSVSERTSLVQTGVGNLTGLVFFCKRANGTQNGIQYGGPVHADISNAVVKTPTTNKFAIMDHDQHTAGSADEYGGGNDLVAVAGDTSDLDAAASSLAELIQTDGQLDIKEDATTNKGTMTQRLLFHSCCLDQIPDDSKFYIGMSFETHDEHEAMVSGTDLTNTVPLHLNLTFKTGSDNIQAPVRQGDLITSFIHYDCVLRVEPDGNVVSSM